MTKPCKVTVDAGVCKMKTVITATANDETGMIELDIQSDCPSILKMSWSIKPICPYSEIGSSINETEVYKMANEKIPHSACPVPCGIIKAIEVAGGLGIKRNVTITVE